MVYKCVKIVNKALKWFFNNKENQWIYWVIKKNIIKNLKAQSPKYQIAIEKVFRKTNAVWNKNKNTNRVWIHGEIRTIKKIKLVDMNLLKR